MPTNAKIPLLGRHTSVLTVDTATVNESTGVWTPAGSPTSIAGYIDNFNDDTTIETERIEGYADTAINPVPIMTGSRVSLTEIMKNSSSPSVLKAAVLSSSAYLIVTETQGDHTVYYIVIESGGRQRGRGKNTYTLSGSTVNIGASNPAVS